MITKLLILFNLEEPGVNAKPSVGFDYQEDSLLDEEDEEYFPESDVSDVEEQGYCDDSSSYNIDLRMRMERVTDERLRKRYDNIDKVGIN